MINHSCSHVGWDYGMFLRSDVVSVVLPYRSRSLCSATGSGFSCTSCCFWTLVRLRVTVKVSSNLLLQFWSCKNLQEERAHSSSLIFRSLLAAPDVPQQETQPDNVFLPLSWVRRLMDASKRSSVNLQIISSLLSCSLFTPSEMEE